jgi:hypothetical protein
MTACRLISAFLLAITLSARAEPATDSGPEVEIEAQTSREPASLNQHLPVRRFKKQARTIEPPLETRTEYFWQPRGGHLAAQVSYSYSTTQYDLKSLGNVTAGSVTQKASSSELDFRYGLSDLFTLGLQWSPVGSVTQDTTINGTPATTITRRASGFGDLKFGVLDTTELETIRLHWGFVLGVPATGAKSPAPSIFAPATAASADGNLSSGGLSAAATFGLSMKVGEEHRLGGKATYRYYGQRTADAQDGTSTTTTGGNEIDIAGFYEFRSGSFYVSPILEADLIDGTVDSNSGKNSTNDTNSLATVETDFGWYFTPSFNLVLKLGYQLKQEVKVGSYKYGSNTPVAQLSTRYEF